MGEKEKMLVSAFSPCPLHALHPLKTNFIMSLQNKHFRGYTGISLSVHMSIHVSVCVQNTSFCQSAVEGIKSLPHNPDFYQP